MNKTKSKRETFEEKIIRGIKLGRQRMLEEKSLKDQYVIYYDKEKMLD